MPPLDSTLYKPSDVGRLYNARIAEFMDLGSKTRFSPADKDRLRTLLLIVDPQVDFVFHATYGGKLTVPGAIMDMIRLIESVYVNLGQITKIITSLDTHLLKMIFFSIWWINPETGEHPDPFTLITSKDLASKKWVPLYDLKWSKYYVEQVESQGKSLIIWPYHTIEGTTGHLIVPPLSEAIAYHSAARSTNPLFYKKGFLPETEHYGIFAPEVAIPDAYSLDQDRENLITEIGTYDRIIVAGEAKSHCVLDTLKQMPTFLPDDIFKRVTLLTDCTSSVLHPVIDFESYANIELAKMQEQGLTLVDSLSLSL